MNTKIVRVLALIAFLMLTLGCALQAQVKPVIGGRAIFYSCDSNRFTHWDLSPETFALPDNERIVSLYIGNSLFLRTHRGSIYVLYMGERFTGDTSDVANLNNFTPRRIPFEKSMVMVAGGGDLLSLYLTDVGDVYATTSQMGRYLFGDGHSESAYRPQKLHLPMKVRAVSGISGTGLFLLEDGTMWSVGRNAGGVAGRGTDSTDVYLGPIEGLLSIRSVRSFESTREQLSSCYAIDSSGNLYTWGVNAGGQIGDGTRKDRLAPHRVDITDVVDATGGQFHSIALRSDGSVWTWGNNTYGQLGIPSMLASFKPVPVTGLPPIREIYASLMSCYAVDSSGRWWAWGQNQTGLMLGIPRADAVRSPTLMQAPCSQSTAVTDDTPQEQGLHPQPATQVTHIRHGLGPDPVTVEIVDALGRTMITMNSTLESIPVDVSSLPSGTYVAFCSTSNASVRLMLHVAR
jgi:alpha-tubulin suppressor-like RCC1 family protein